MSPLRRDPSLRRVPGKRATRPVILIVCEGETECEYFRALLRRFRVNTASVLIAVGSSPTGVVRCALQRYRARGPFDAVYCVFDRDSHADFDAARRQIAGLAARKGRARIPIEESISVPCIELWFLLHFGYSAAAHRNCDAADHALRAQMPTYRKNDPGSADQLATRVETAIANAQRLEGAAQRDGFSNPFTTAYRVAEGIRALRQTEPLTSS